MSVNGTNTGSASSQSVQSSNFDIHTHLNSLIMSHTFLILLVPLIVSLFCYSTPQSRRRPVFLLNLAAILLALAVGILIDMTLIQTILEPSNPPSLVVSIVTGFFAIWQSIFVDLVLLVRLISVYPPKRIGLIYFPLLITIPVLLKLTRVSNLILFITAAFEAANGPNAEITTEIVFYQKPYLKIEWATQMIDNTYVSLAFLWEIRDRTKKRVTNPSSVTLMQRMRTLSRIALTNFFIPTAFSIAQFICFFRGVNEDVLQQLLLVNVMLSTFGVAFATIWAGNISQQGAQLLDSKRDNSTNYLMRVVESGGIRHHQPESAMAITSWGNTLKSEGDETLMNEIQQGYAVAY